MKITTAFFSATNTTKSVVNAIAQTISKEVQNYNLASHPVNGEVIISPSEILLVGMPVYGGRIPGVAAESLRHFRGSHTPAIVVAVYGNREYEDALVEMQDILEENGFFILAAGTFIAQHSIFPGTAKGRPDRSDFDKIKDFGEQCKSKIAKGFGNNACSVSLPGNRPYKIPGNIPLKMATDSSCTECGACIKACPVQAIPMDNPHVTDDDKCIHCGRCMTVCTAHARHYRGLLFHVAGAVFGWKNRKRKEPEFFL